MMKHPKYLLIFAILMTLLFVVPAGLSAQRDTTGTAAKTDSIVEYLTPLEYAFMMHEETRFMLRVPAVGVGAEVEVLPYFTLMGQAQIVGGNYTDFIIGLTGEVRYYYGSKKKGVNNMSGNYIGLGYQSQSFLPTGLSGFHSNQFNINQYYARWGVQRRFLGRGLIDLGVNMGYKKQTYSYDSGSSRHENMILQTTGTIGLGLVFNKEKHLDQERLCPALKCFDRETFLLKLNTLNFLKAQYSDKYKQTSIQLTPQVGLEQKLFNSPFSIGANLKLAYFWNHRNSDKYYKGTSTSYFIDGRIQARYYYNLKNRILKGKSGNGFSANYLSVGFYDQYYSPGYRELKLNERAITLTTGIQRTFSKHLYFDVELGLAKGPQKNAYNNNIEFFGDIQLGIKF